jgi:hypothetical protein
MNLRVDLLLDSERRSSSMLSLRSIIRIGSIVGPIALVVFLLLGGMAFFRTVHEVNMLESRWKEMQPRTKEAARCLADYQVNREVVKSIEGWRRSRLAVHEQLLGLMRIVPPEVQLLRLTLLQDVTVGSNKVPGRVFSLNVQGKATGASAELRVKETETRLLGMPPFAGLMQKADVVQYGADVTQGAGKDDRVFQIACRYAPREIK